MIDRDHPRLSIVRQCELVGIARSSYYYEAKGEDRLNLELMRVIDAPFMETPWYGSRQMARYLRRKGYGAGRKRIRRLMRKMGLAAIYQAPRTSQPHPEHRIYPYLLREMTIDRPQPGLVCGHLLHPDAARVPVPGGDHGLGEPKGAVLAVVEHDGRGVLR